MPAPTVPRRRLGGLNNPSIGRKISKKAPAPPRPSGAEQRCCDAPKVEDEDGHRICKNCFTEIAENNIVADVTFEEDSRGAHTVQGGFIGDNARHARTLGTAARRLGGDQRNAMQEIEANGRRALNALCPRLGIPEAIASQAAQLFIVASQNRFSSGRKTEEVAAACLYAACRRQKDNTTMLIDISELLSVNVFRLGEVYKDMCTKLYLDEGDGEGPSVGVQYMVEVENLVMKYCRKLEFGDATRQVAEDAVRILKRMKRDWMVTGRHPAGLCGACIILAARMNNFRRTVREVVLVAKVADVTISKRVEEFRRTKSAALTVEQFREYGARLKHQHNPPILYESQLRKERFEAKKRKRQSASASREQSVVSIPDDDGSPAASPRASPLGEVTSEQAQNEQRRKRQKTTHRSPAAPVAQMIPPSAEGHESSQRGSAPITSPVRIDADGFVIPALPASQASEAQQERVTRKRGRPKKATFEPIIITDEELATEEELEKDISQVLDDEVVIESRDEIQLAKDEARAKATAERQKLLAAETSRSRREAEGTTAWFDGSVASNDKEEITAEDLEIEFANDPEVMNCELTPEEKRIKEQIWVTYNEDWLRVQHEKRLIAEVNKAHPQTAGRRGAKGGKRKKRGKLGDGTTLAEATTPIETPADASQAMLERRATTTFSKNLDYSVLSRIYGNRSRSSSRAASVAASETEVSTVEEQRSESGRSSRRPNNRPTTPARTTEGEAGAGVVQDAPDSDVEVEEDYGPGHGDNSGYNDYNENDDDDDYHSDGGTEDAGRGFWTGDGAEEDGEDDEYGRALGMASRQTANFGTEFGDEGEYEEDGY